MARVSGNNIFTHETQLIDLYTHTCILSTIQEKKKTNNYREREKETVVVITYTAHARLYTPQKNKKTRNVGIYP